MLGSCLHHLASTRLLGGPGSADWESQAPSDTYASSRIAPCRTSEGQWQSHETPTTTTCRRCSRRLIHAMPTSSSIVESSESFFPSFQSVSVCNCSSLRPSAPPPPPPPLFRNPQQLHHSARSGHRTLSRRRGSIRLSFD